MGINWAGIVFGLGAVIAMGYWTTDFLVVQRVLAAKDLRSAELAPIIGAAFKMCVPFIVILPGLLGLALLRDPHTGNLLRLVPADLAWSPAGQAQGLHGYDEVLPLMLGPLLRSGPARPGHHCSDRGLHVGNGGQRQRLHHGLDL